MPLGSGFLITSNIGITLSGLHAHPSLTTTTTALDTHAARVQTAGRQAGNDAFVLSQGDSNQIYVRCVSPHKTR